MSARPLCTRFTQSAIVLAIAATPLASQPAETAAFTDPRIERHSAAPFEALDLELPGRLSAWVPQRRARGEDRIFFLTREGEPDTEEEREEGETTHEVSLQTDGVETETGTQAAPPAPDDAWWALFVLTPSNDDLRYVPVELPPGDLEIDVADLDGDGNDELLIESEDGSFFVRGVEVDEMAVEPLATRRRVRLGHRAAATKELTAGLPLQRLGEITVLSDDGERQSVAIPVRASRTQHGLVLFSPQATAAQTQDGELIALVGPELAGDRRVRVTTYGTEQANSANQENDDSESEESGPATESGPPEESGPTEAWGLLPGPESLEKHYYFYLEGRRQLMVFTQSSDKLGIFERQRLRVFDLDDDRTRVGSKPLLAHQTASYRWQEPSFLVADLDRDEKEDLVVLEPDGLASGKLVVQAFFGDGSGGFDGRKASSKLERPADDAVLIENLLGDGRIHLAIVDGGQLGLHTLTPTKTRLFRKTPNRVLLGSTGSNKRGRRLAQTSGAIDLSLGFFERFVRPRKIDLEEDDQAELLFIDRDETLSKVRLLSVPNSTP